MLYVYNKAVVLTHIHIVFKSNSTQLYYDFLNVIKCLTAIVKEECLEICILSGDRHNIRASYNIIKFIYSLKILFHFNTLLYKNIRKYLRFI